ncbi:MAG: cobyrinate a,c-diamide synthase, partial [Candidatus Methanospirareceae archaeon]
EVYDIARDTKFGYRMLRGTGIDGVHDGIVEKRTLAGFTHLHFAYDEKIVENIIKNMIAYKKR